MNLLVDALPRSITIDGAEYALNTDYRAALKSILAFEDDTLTDYEKQIVLLNNLLIDVPARMDEEVLRQIGRFMNGDNQAEPDKTAPRLYSFSKDANLIFSAFRQTHGIDLQKADLHWWEFLALFMDLGQDTTFCQLIGLRKRVKAGTATKEEKQAAREMGESFDIPESDTRTLDEKEKEAEFMRLIGVKK
jgi:hypothetical protein